MKSGETVGQGGIVGEFLKREKRLKLMPLKLIQGLSE